MAATSRNVLKGWFVTGARPTQGQFANLIDSCFNLTDDQLTVDDINGLANLIARANTNPQAIPFTAGEASPLQINNWQANYFQAFGNGAFSVQFIDADGNLQEQPIFPTRIIDRTGATPVQSAVKLDLTGFPNGQVILYYQKTPII